GIGNPRLGGRRPNGMAVEIEEIEGSLGNAELVDRVDHRTRGARRFHLPDMRGADELLRCLTHGVVELPRKLQANDQKQSAAEQAEDHAERRYVPRGELETKRGKRVPWHRSIAEAVARATQR